MGTRLVLEPSPKVLAKLGPAARGRVIAASHHVAEAWRSDEPLLEVTEALRQLVPGCLMLAYDWAAPGKIGNFVLASDRSVARRPPPFATSELPRRIRYSIDPNVPEPDANLPVLSSVLYARDFEWMRGVRESVLEQFGAWDQLRTAIYDRHRFICLLGHLRAKDDGFFEAEHAHAMKAVIPIVREVLVAHEVLQLKGSSGGPIAKIIDAFAEPAFLVSASGTVVFANRAARKGCGDGSVRIDALFERGFDAAPSVRVVPLAIDGTELRLVIPEEAQSPVALDAPPRPVHDILGLPPSLARVCELLLEGLSEKEVADRAELSLPSVRKYVSRIYVRLGVHSRSELARRAVQLGWRPRA